MSFYVYILQCSDGSYYTGHTDNLERRLAAHDRGEILGYTYGRRPVRLVFVEEFTAREDAFARERQVKGWRRSKKQALIRREWDVLTELAKAYGSTEPVLSLPKGSP